MDLAWGGTIAKEGKLSYSFGDTDLYRHRNEIWFSTNVTSKSINKLIKLVYEVIHDKDLSAYRDTPEFEVVIHIDSPGGEVVAMFKFVDFVKQLNKKDILFRTIINGRACSAATLIAIVGNKRQMTEHSTAMIHELQAITGGYHTHVQSYVKYLMKLHNTIVELYNSHRKIEDVDDDAIKVSDIEKWMSDESWFDAKEYLKMGFVDEII